MEGDMADKPDRPREPEAIIDPVDLGDRVRAKRRSRKLTIREAAKEIGVSAPTVSRVERGSHLPDRRNLLRLARWASVRIDPVLHTDTRRMRNALVHDPGATTTEAVELHLRADKNLSRDDAEALAEMFRLAYEALSGRRPRSKGDTG
jgi:transcriptional regulator with XRE-family HTH domain